jgi:hypothetical protein
MDLAERIVWVVNWFLVLVVVTNLVASRLHRIYFWFFAMLCFQALQTPVLMYLRAASERYDGAYFSDRYAETYFVTQSALWVLYMFAVLELYSLALRKHQGLASMSRWFMLSALFVSVSVSALTLKADLSRPAGSYPYLLYFSVFERGVAFSMVVLMVLITGFLLWTPISIRRNIVVHASLFSIYFLASTIPLFLRNLFGDEVAREVSIALLAANSICLLLWAFLLNKRGEETMMVVRSRWKPVDEVRLARQMDAVNAFLLKSSNK